jgi:hypothetical protein
MDNALVGRVALTGMDRRRAIAVLGAVLFGGCTGSRSRATGPRTPPTPGDRRTTSDGAGSMGVFDLDVEAADDGHLRVHATVANRTDRDRTRTLVLRVTIDGTVTERTREVTVPANDESRVTVDFETVAYESFSGNGSLQPTLR